MTETDKLDFEAIETAVKRRALALAARAVEARLNADLSDYAGPWADCDRGHRARYAGRREKTFRTAIGDLTLERAYYDCEICRKGFSPRDRAWGLEGGSLSPTVMRMVGLSAAMVSFQESGELMRELADVRVSTKQIERTAEALGREMAADEREVVEPALDVEVMPTMYLGMDGTGVPIRRSELENRKGKQPDGSAKTREVKLCTVWSAETVDEYGAPVRDEGSISYSAAIESAATDDLDPHPSPFARRVIRAIKRRGIDRADRVAVLGDGAPWIWKLADHYLPEAVQIVDLFHVEERLSNLSKEIFGKDKHRAAAWAKKRQAHLEAGEIDWVIGALELHADSNEDARKGIGYFKTNYHRMQYAKFRKKGLCTSTAVVEAGCKTAIGARLKRAGMHWSVDGANDIIALRCCKLSGGFEDFWERRAARTAGAKVDPVSQI